MADNDTFVDTLALGSPSGRMSKRALKAAQDRIHKQLFPDGFPEPKGPKQPPRSEKLRRDAAMLYDLAARGMHPRSYKREADKLIAEAEALEQQEAKE